MSAKSRDERYLGFWFLPGAMKATLTSLMSRWMKVEKEVPALMDEWYRRGGKGIGDLLRADYAMLVDRCHGGTYQIRFIKCRNGIRVLSWCQEQWGDPGAGARWELMEHHDTYCPRILVRDEEAMILFRMVWE